MSLVFYFFMPLSLVSTFALIVVVDVQKSKCEQDKGTSGKEVY